MIEGANLVLRAARSATTYARYCATSLATTAAARSATTFDLNVH
jgi:hypothetical protein